LPVSQFLESTGAAPDSLPEDQLTVERWLLKTGNRRVSPPDFRWVVAHLVESVGYPGRRVVLERGVGQRLRLPAQRLRGRHAEQRRPGSLGRSDARLERVDALRAELDVPGARPPASINYQLDRLRLERRAWSCAAPPPTPRGTHPRASGGGAAGRVRRGRGRAAGAARQALRRDALRLETADGQTIEVNLAELVRAWRPTA
jgi:phosphate transport system permease protein